VVIYLERGADLHMAQLMSLPLTVSRFSKIQIGFTSLVPAHPGSPSQRAVKRVCVFLYRYSYSTITVPVRGNNLQMLLTLPWLPYMSSPPFSSRPFCLHPPTILLYSPYFSYPICGCDMPTQLLYSPVLHYIQLYRLCYPRRRHAYTAATHTHNRLTTFDPGPPG